MEPTQGSMKTGNSLPTCEPQLHIIDASDLSGLLLFAF